jgi:hypothetical protein
MPALGSHYFPRMVAANCHNHVLPTARSARAEQASSDPFALSCLELLATIGTIALASRSAVLQVYYNAKLTKTHLGEYAGLLFSALWYLLFNTSALACSENELLEEHKMLS